MTVTFAFHMELVNYCFDTKNVTLNIYFYPFHGIFNPRYIHTRVLIITSEKREKNKKKKQNKRKNKSKIRNETEKKNNNNNSNIFE